jgi:hypothetical protein
MQKKIFNFSLFFLSLVAAFFSWFSLSNAITVTGASVWLVPAIWLSFFYLVYSLEFVVFAEKTLAILSIILGIFLSLIFVHNFGHVVVLFLATGLLFAAYRQIKNDLGMNVKLHLPKTLRMGKTAFMLSIALVISSQYYFQAKEAGLLKLPVFDANVILDNDFARGILYKLNPDLQKLEDKNLTVDELILQNFQESQAGMAEAQLLNFSDGNQVISADSLQKMENLQKQKILESGREQLGKMVGRKLTGSEKVADVLTENMNQKVQSLVSPDYANGKFPAVPIGMAVILFLTVLSLGAFLVRILVHFVGFAFWLLTLMHVVRIKKVPVEMEVIEE